MEPLLRHLALTRAWSLLRNFGRPKWISGQPRRAPFRFSERRGTGFLPRFTAARFGADFFFGLVRTGFRAAVRVAFLAAGRALARALAAGFGVAMPVAPFALLRPLPKYRAIGSR